MAQAIEATELAEWNFKGVPSLSYGLKAEFAFAVVATSILPICTEIYQFYFKRIHVRRPVIESEMRHVGEVELVATECLDTCKID